MMLESQMLSTQTPEAALQSQQMLVNVKKQMSELDQRQQQQQQTFQQMQPQLQIEQSSAATVQQTQPQLQIEQSEEAQTTWQHSLQQQQ